MKPQQVITSDFEKFTSTVTNEGFCNQIVEPLTFKTFSIPPPMTQQEVTPPAYVWENIARVLDEQDRMKAVANKTTPFATIIRKQFKSKAIVFAAIIALSGAMLFSVL